MACRNHGHDGLSHTRLGVLRTLAEKTDQLSIVHSSSEVIEVNLVHHAIAGSCLDEHTNVCSKIYNRPNGHLIVYLWNYSFEMVTETNLSSLKYYQVSYFPHLDL